LEAPSVVIRSFLNLETADGGESHRREARSGGAALARLSSSWVAAAWNRRTSPYGRAISMAPSRPPTIARAASLADHDAWVVGDEPAVVVDWYGASN
jgi:hypothetical protein